MFHCRNIKSDSRPPAAAGRVCRSDPPLNPLLGRGLRSLRSEKGTLKYIITNCYHYRVSVVRTRRTPNIRRVMLVRPIRRDAGGRP